MNWQPALATSAFRGLHDELIAYVTLFCDARELLQLAQTNSVFFVFCREEPLWMMLCLHRHGGDFSYKDNWRLTTFFPRDRPAEMPIYPPLTIRGFASDFLYRRWCRCHMDLKNFVPPDAAQDPAAKRVKKFETKDLTYQQYFEEYSRVPFILKNAIGNWKASTEWTVEKFIERYPHNAKHRLTHNLDFFGSGKSLQLTFADYFQYISQQNDETPLYIFDPDFGEKLPELLDDYKIDDLKFFKEDLLKDAANANDEKKKKKKEKSGASSTANGQGDSKKIDVSNQAASSGGDDNQKKEAKKRSKSESLRPDFRWVVIGPQRTGAPWHTDPARTSAWNALVKGRKRWAIYPPDSPPPGVSMGKNKNGREHALNMTSLSWYLHVYPTLEPHQKPIEVIQEEGEVIYVPNGWWHLILNLETTIAVTQNFVDSHNLMGFMKDLLDDQQDEPLSQFQHSIKTSRPETFDLFRLMQIPRVHGYLNQDMYVSTFSILEPWKTPIMKILKRHHRALSKFGVLKIDDETKKTQVARLKSLTSRVNPAFAVGKSVLIKFFSHFNQRWGEFDFSSYLAPNFKAVDEAEGNGAESPLKRRKQTILQPHELKRTMNLRRAMEESFRIEKETYEMIASASRSPKVSEFMESLQSMVPQLFQSGHMLHVEEVDDEDGEGSLWRWPYVVIEYRGDLDGLDKLVKKGGVTKECWLSTAKWISAEFVARLHAVPIDANLHGLYGHSKASWDWYVHYLTCQRKRAMAFHYKEDAISPQLMNQLEKFLPSSNADSVVKYLLPASMGTTNPVLLHGDITQENILGSSSIIAAVKSNSAVRKTAASNGAQAHSMDLTAYLNSIGCGKYVSLLVEEEELTMESLAFVGEVHLKELGIPLGPRLSILKNAGREIVNGTAHAKISNGHANVNTSLDVEEEDWETCSSSSDSSDEDDESGPALQAKRLAKFIGPHEWQPSFVIDFADAKTGDPLYDLVAIFFAALSSNRELWKATLDTEYWCSYIQREQQAAGNATKLRERFLKLVLLHPSRSVKSLFYYFPDAMNLLTWEDVARSVFEDIFKA